MDATELIPVMGVVIPFVVQTLKGLFPKANPRYFSIGLCFFVGLVYALANEFVPQEFVARLATVGAATFAVATSLYRLNK